VVLLEMPQKGAKVQVLAPVAAKPIWMDGVVILEEVKVEALIQDCSLVKMVELLVLVGRRLLEIQSIRRFT